jgi:hypothetical protein
VHFAQPLAEPVSARFQRAYLHTQQTALNRLTGQPIRRAATV